MLFATFDVLALMSSLVESFAARLRRIRHSLEGGGSLGTLLKLNLIFYATDCGFWFFCSIRYVARRDGSSRTASGRTAVAD